MDSALTSLLNQGSAWVAGRRARPARRGNRHPSIVPYETYETADRPFAIAVGNDRMFARLCDGVGLAELAARRALRHQRRRASRTPTSSPPRWRPSCAASRPTTGSRSCARPRSRPARSTRSTRRSRSPSELGHGADARRRRRPADPPAAARRRRAPADPPRAAAPRRARRRAPRLARQLICETVAQQRLDRVGRRRAGEPEALRERSRARAAARPARASRRPRRSRRGRAPRPCRRSPHDVPVAVVVGERERRTSGRS